MSDNWWPLPVQRSSQPHAFMTFLFHLQMKNLKSDTIASQLVP